jgi:hypothetical protein
VFEHGSGQGTQVLGSGLLPYSPALQEVTQAPLESKNLGASHLVQVVAVPAVHSKQVESQSEQFPVAVLS